MDQLEVMTRLVMAKLASWFLPTAQTSEPAWSRAFFRTGNWLLTGSEIRSVRGRQVCFLNLENANRWNPALELFALGLLVSAWWFDTAARLLRLKARLLHREAQLLRDGSGFRRLLVGFRRCCVQVVLVCCFPL